MVKNYIKIVCKINNFIGICQQFLGSIFLDNSFLWKNSKMFSFKTIQDKFFETICNKKVH